MHPISVNLCFLLPMDILLGHGKHTCSTRHLQNLWAYHLSLASVFSPLANILMNTFLKVTFVDNAKVHPRHSKQWNLSMAKS